MRALPTVSLASWCIVCKYRFDKLSVYHVEWSNVGYILIGLVVTALVFKDASRGIQTGFGIPEGIWGKNWNISRSGWISFSSNWISETYIQGSSCWYWLPAHLSDISICIYTTNDTSPDNTLWRSGFSVWVYHTVHLVESPCFSIFCPFRVNLSGFLSGWLIYRYAHDVEYRISCRLILSLSSILSNGFEIIEYSNGVLDRVRALWVRVL